MSEGQPGKTSPLTGTERGGAARPVRLAILEGPSTGTAFLLREGTALVGTHPSCSLVLTDPTASRRHAQVELAGDTIRIKDLGSTNGIRFLGARVESMTLPFGSSVVLGQTRVGFLDPERDAGEMLTPGTPLLDELVGRSRAMQLLFRDVLRVAGSDLQVLIHGETGTGKELVARAIHARSPLASGKLVVVDCVSLQSDTAVSTLFGHVRGSFTGATRDQLGLLELAANGTLMLDGVSELPSNVQTLLLRALESGEFQRLGEATLRHSHCRVIATSQVPLAESVKRGTFRQDLYFRLAGATLEVPPLRERLEDLPALAARFAQEASGAPFPFRPEVLSALISHRWPGNVRELRNVVARSVALGKETGLERPQEDVSEPGYYASREQAMVAFERSYLASLLERHQGSASAAAKEARVNRSYFYRLLTKHGLAGGKAGA